MFLAYFLFETGHETSLQLTHFTFVWFLSECNKNGIQSRCLSGPLKDILYYYYIFLILFFYFFFFLLFLQVNISQYWDTVKIKIKKILVLIFLIKR